MTIQEFAKMLDGREMGEEITIVEKEQAKKLGFVVVYGYSDDNTEFEGAIDEEVGCYEGDEIHLDTNGIFEECEEECKYSQLAKKKCKVIEAVWDKEGYSWVYATDIPHATFDIMEDGEKFCRGIVFDIKSLGEWDEPSESMTEPMKDNLLKLLKNIKIFVEAGALEAEFEAFTGYEEPIETIEELIEAMESEMSYWEPEGEGEA